MENDIAGGKEPLFISEHRVKELAWYLWESLQERPPSKLEFELWWRKALRELLAPPFPEVNFNLTVAQYEELLRQEEDVVG